MMETESAISVHEVLPKPSYSAKKSKNGGQNSSFFSKHTSLELSTQNLNVSWKALILTNPMVRRIAKTTTAGYLPNLAQDEPEIVIPPPTFKNPLANLSLDEVEVSEIYEPPKLDGKQKQVSRSSMMNGISTVARSTTTRTNTKRKFLHTIPDKYLAIPPLVRNAYFYSNGRCMACAGSAGNRRKSHSFCSQSDSKCEMEIRTTFDKHTAPYVSNFTRDGEFEHLIGKTKHRISDGLSENCVQKIENRIEYIQGSDSLESKGSQRAVVSNSDPVSNIDNNVSSNSLEAKQIENFYTERSSENSIITFASAKKELMAMKRLSGEKNAGTSQLLRLRNKRFTPRNQLKPDVEDLKYMYSGTVILAAKVKDYDLHIPLISLDTEEMRELYTVTILNDNSLRRLFHIKNINKLPDGLQYLKTIKNPDIQEETATSNVVLDADSDKDHQFRVTMENTTKCVLSELATQFYEIDFLILGLFANWLERAKEDKSLLQLKTSKEFAKFFQILGEDLIYSVYDPAVSTRLEILYVLATAANENRIRHHMWLHVKLWLEPLLSSLFAERVGIREETCYTLAFLFSSNTLVNDIRHNLSLNMPYDVTVAVIKAIETKPESFMHFFCLLAYIVEGCPSITILDAVMERGPTCKNYLFRQRWPLLIYYAFRYWNNAYLYVEPLYHKRLTELIEYAYMVPLSRKASKMALLAIGIRTKRVLMSVTCWLPEWLNTE